jgi:hypothetical protein
VGDLVNLRRFRKGRDRAGRAEDAARNRASFGRTREERDASADEAARAAARLDGHRRDAPPDDTGCGAPQGGPSR